ncbi:MAG: histidinol dehydrogenase, partial [Gammaproteobacteria bacterium]|nr:histidinol dehydrogenase [Gammaproteobacteria bacterium]
MARLDTGAADFDAALARLGYWEASGDEAVERSVAEIVRDVRERGDAAVLEYSRRFDGLDADSLTELRLDAARLAEAHAGLPRADRQALDAAATRIRDFHERQLEDAASFDYEDGLGNRLGQRVVPLDRVGVYVPGGQAAYPSTALMTLVPARVAGVGQRIVVVPTPGGRHSDHVLAALHV